MGRKIRHGEGVASFLNNAVICSIGYYTTGLDHMKHDLCEVALVPLNSFYKPMKGIVPFLATIRPNYPENIDWDNLPRYVSRKRVVDWTNTGFDAFDAADMFEEWFHKTLNMPARKRLFPLGARWPYGRQFIERWLGSYNFDFMFDPRYRDPCAVACFVNDSLNIRGQNVFYYKQTISYLKSHYKIVNPSPHTALGDAVTVAAIYEKMMHRGMMSHDPNAQAANSEELRPDLDSDEDESEVVDSDLKEH